MNQASSCIIIILFLFTLIFTSCSNKHKFDKTKWAEVEDLMIYPHRKYMIDDLIQTYELKGKSYNDIVALLGPPGSTIDSTLEIFYNIEVKYGLGVDPSYTKTLLIQFNKDTIVKDFMIREGRHH